ncbi:MAG: DMT family transporter [Candidatus Odinarchaeota archaeon]
MSFQENKQYYTLLCMTMFFWGITWPVAKILVAIAPPMTIGFFRFLIAFILFIPVFLYTYSSRKPANKSLSYSLSRFAALGFVGMFGYGVFFLIGMNYTTAAQGSIIAGVNPVSVSLAAHIMHGERLPDRWRYWGFPLSFIGVVFVIGVQSLIEFQPEYLFGNLLVLSAMICMGVYSSLGKRVMKYHSSLETTMGGCFFGMIFFGITASTEQFWTLNVLLEPVFWSGILVLGGLASFLGFFFYLHAIRKIGATNSGIFINLVPVVGTLSSAILLQEPIYWTFIVGLIFISAGIFLINFPSTNSSDKNL